MFVIVNSFTVPRKARSVVWDYFTKHEIEEEGRKQTITVCNTCQGRVAFSSNTSNQLSHLRLRHNNIYESVRPYMELPPPRAPKNNRNRIGLMEESLASTSAGIFNISD